MTDTPKDSAVPNVPDALFAPLKIGPLRLRNRIVMAPMTREQATGGVPSPLALEYYRRRAAGGAGLLVTEGIALEDPLSQFRSTIPDLHGAALPAWKRITQAVHDEGAAIVAQLWHAGLSREVEHCQDPRPSIGPGTRLPGSGRTGRAMSHNEISDTITAYGRAARNAYEAGFDGVNVHGAHGYLIDQFFWDQANSRTDGYGGDLAGRSAFAIAVIKRIKQMTSPDFPVMFRFSQWKTMDYGACLVTTPEELGRFLTPLAEAGVDIFDASTRRFWLPEFEGSTMNLAGWAKHLTGIPTMTVGSVTLTEPRRRTETSEEVAPTVSLNNLDRLNAMVASGEVDLVAVGRAMIANPDWADLVRRGAFDKLRAYHSDMLHDLH